MGCFYYYYILYHTHAFQQDDDTLLLLTFQLNGLYWETGEKKYTNLESEYVYLFFEYFQELIKEIHHAHDFVLVVSYFELGNFQM